MKEVISGASGLVGTALTKELQRQGDTVVRLVRPGHAKQARDISWEPTARKIDAAGLNGADAVVDLSGASIAGARWTPKRKAELRGSRIDTTKLLVDTFASMKNRPKIFVAASAVGYYGNRADEVLTEQSTPGTGFLAQLARDWEAEARRAETLNIRTVILRFGVVLARKGGALPQMLRPFRFGVGGRMGDGQQWLSWITLVDLVAVILEALRNDRYYGVFNAVAPAPVRNADFARIAGASLQRPAVLPAPRFALRLLLGEMADDALLASQRAVPARLESIGYTFQFPTLEASLRAILHAEK
jgi:uncharacterized protein (TIGR01777 family)